MKINSALHQELLTVMLAWLGNNKSICDWQSALVGEIIAKEYKEIQDILSDKF